MDKTAFAIGTFEEEKKTPDSVSLTEGFDSSIQRKDTEQGHRREIMQGKERGGSPLRLGHAGIEAGHDYATDEDFHGVDPNAPLRLAVLGPQDDLSTIAGDTISGSVVTAGAVFSNANLPRTIETGKPIQRDFKEYEFQTPAKSKKKRWHPYMNRDDDDDGTHPETPPGIIGVSKKDEESAEKDGESTWVSYGAPSKRMYICACVFGFILLVLIIGLAVAYTQMGDDETKTKDASTDQPKDSNGGFDKDDLAALTPKPTQPPNDESLAALLGLLEETGVLNPASFLDNEMSPQARAMLWVAADPSFGDYTNSRIIQRYVLAVFAYEVVTADDAGSGRALYRALPTWLDYEVNECDWFTTLEREPVCDGFGYYVHLDLADQGLMGTLPTEISLLSDSLAFIDLRGNRFGGTIPSELADLSQLQSLVLSSNMLSGDMPTQLGRMKGLQVLSFALNDLSGPIPSEIGQMQSLSRLLLQNNSFVGSIPSEMGNLGNLVTMDLSGNDLSGEIPYLGNLTVLTSLNLQHNSLTGEVDELCGLGLTTLEADCHRINCTCCTACTDIGTRQPTLMPSFSPTIATPSPTAQPTACVSKLQWPTDCVGTGDAFEVRFVNCQPEFGDWIGIFDKDADPSSLPEPYLWAWSCGSQSCRGTPLDGTVLFDETTVEATVGMWPLANGDYQAYMIRNTGSPYVGFAVSDKLKVKGNGC